MEDTLEINVSELIRVSEGVGAKLTEEQKGFLKKWSERWKTFELKEVDIGTSGITFKFGRLGR